MESFIERIFEANLINLIILDGGLFYLLSGTLSDSLSERQEKIVGAIQESEERLKEATARLTESETQLAQTQTHIGSKVAKKLNFGDTLLPLSRAKISELESFCGNVLHLSGRVLEILYLNAETEP
jgi:hypothetical protein